MIRKPAVAGQFYPAAKEALKKTVEEFLQSGRKPVDAKGIGVPHAGYIYSGSTAGKTYAAVNVPEVCIILAPNHRGIGSSAAIMTDESWMTPLGEVKINTDLGMMIRDNSELIEEDITAHIGEHSLEVQLPFLQVSQNNLEIVPICLKALNASDCRSIGKTIADAVKSFDRDVLIVASTDMNHYEEHEITLKKDEEALEKIKEMDAEGLLKVTSEKRISMCGVIPAAVMINAVKELGSQEVEIVEHLTSGDVSGDYNSVVGYAGFILK